MSQVTEQSVRLQTALASMNLLSASSVFFFQAEDGIRDKLVTGVQTCALPIYRRVVVDADLELHEEALARREAAADRGRGPGAEEVLDEVVAGRDDVGGEIVARSEERRVGKEWRSGSSPETSNKTDDNHTATGL